MNQEQDKELDVLLRRYAKREEQRAKVAVSADEGNSKILSGFAESEHLDADGMNAYAENALPVSARARYTEHLVGCDVCRKVVTQLALTANPIGFEKEEGITVTATQTQTWRERLISFLTFPSLKLAGSIAAVLFVATITFVIWQRSDKTSQSLPNQEARNHENGSTAAYDHKDDSSKPENGNVANSPESTTKEKAKTTANNPSSGEGKTAPAKSGETPATEAKKNEDETASDRRKDAPKEAEKDQTKTAANQPQPTPPPVNTQAGSGPSASQNQVNTQTQETVAQQRQNPGKAGGPNRGRDAEGRAAKPSSTSPTPPTDTVSEDKNKSDTGERAEEKQKKAAPRKQAANDKAANDADDVALAGNRAKREAATPRTVSGKKFQRIDDAWVDTAYKNSAITIIKRGSEQYNALEAGLRSIAEQLGGEVIVVWKGRAYKIR